MNSFDRVKLLVGEENYNKLKNSTVAIFGIGGVGGFTAEALCRSGVGNIILIDGDTVDESNINRQIIATEESVGKDKVLVMKERLLSINPNVSVTTHKIFYLSENADSVNLDGVDYVVDAVDTVSAKLSIIERAKNANIPVITCMGTGGKLDPTALKVGTVEKTNGCPLARVIRRELKKRNLFNVKAVYSEENVVYNQSEEQLKADGKKAPPSMIFVPATAGLILAREVVVDLIKEKL